MFNNVADRLIAGEPIVHGSLGITVNTIPEEEGGLEVLSVEEISEAYTAGLRPGDVILRVNGELLNNAQQFTRIKLAMGAGDTVDLTIRRGDLIFECTVPLTATEILEGFR